MSIFKVLLILIGILFSVESFGQVTFGAKTGGNYSNPMFDIDSDYGNDPETETKLGFHIGLTLDIPLIENTLSFQPTLLYTTKGYGFDMEKIVENLFDNVENYDGYLRLNYNYIEIPTNVVYKNNGFQILAGTYLAVGIGGSMSHDFSFKGDGDDYNSDDFIDNKTYKLQAVLGTVDNDLYEAFLDNSENVLELYRALDFGLNVGVGYQVSNILFNAGYSIGLVNMTPRYAAGEYGIDEDYTKDVVQKNRVFTFSVAYFFK